MSISVIMVKLKADMATKTAVIAAVLMFIHSVSGIRLLYTASLCDRAERIQNVIHQQCAPDKLEMRCYPQLGCFPMDHPWTSTLRLTPHPSSPSEVGVQVYCYTRNPRMRYTVKLWPIVDLGGCRFSPARGTVFVTHGYIQSAKHTWLHRLKDNYINAEDVNVFLVDWSKGAQVISYLQGVANTRIAGAEVARFIKLLKDKHGLRPSDVHLIGHSLGAHVMAYAAKRVPDIGHLTALDPSQPAFEDTDKEVRLDKNDADFVEVIHTNAILGIGYGLLKPHGDVDIYINGGQHQPGCPLPDLSHNIGCIKNIADIPCQELYEMLFCSHIRAYEYYIEALESSCVIMGHQAKFEINRLFRMDGVIAMNPGKCYLETCIPLGPHARFSPARGTFAATTDTTSPYCSPDDMDMYRLPSKFDKFIRLPKVVSNNITYYIIP